MEQLVFFDPPPRSLQELDSDLADTRAQLSRLRRGLFRRHAEITADMARLATAMEDLCRHLDERGLAQKEIHD